MIIPKRFKLDKAASPKPQLDAGLHLDTIHIRNNTLLASNGSGAAIVPILGTSDRPSADFPRLEPGEELHDGVIPLQAILNPNPGLTY